jgi:5'-methylthioadenosine nucleosidase
MSRKLSILIIITMPKEADPLIESLKMLQLKDAIDHHIPAKIYTIKKNNSDVFLAVGDNCPRYNVPRVGTQAAAILAWETMRTFTPNVIINVGTAGGFKINGATIGDIYLSNESIKYHDRNFNPKKPSFVDYAFGNYPCIDLKPIANILGLKDGLISTGNNFYHTAEEYDIMVQNGIVAKEMEAAAIAEVAQLRQVPFAALKGITDLIDSQDSAQQFVDNFKIVTEKLAEKTEDIINYFLETHDWLK